MTVLVDCRDFVSPFSYQKAQLLRNTYIVLNSTRADTTLSFTLYFDDVSPNVFICVNIYLLKMLSVVCYLSCYFSKFLNVFFQYYVTASRKIHHTIAKVLPFDVY